MLLTLTLAAGLLAAAGPPAEQPKGWVVEVRGFTQHPQARPEGEGWIIEVRGFTEHRKQAEPPKGLIIDFQWPQAKPQPGPVAGQHSDDLSAFFKQFQVHVEVVEALYVDDLPAFFRQLKNR